MFEFFKKRQYNQVTVDVLKNKKTYYRQKREIPGDPGQLRVKDDQEWREGPNDMQRTF